MGINQVGIAVGKFEDLPEKGFLHHGIHPFECQVPVLPWCVTIGSQVAQGLHHDMKLVIGSGFSNRALHATFVTHHNVGGMESIVMEEEMVLIYSLEDGLARTSSSQMLVKQQVNLETAMPKGWIITPPEK